MSARNAIDAMVEQLSGESNSCDATVPVKSKKTDFPFGFPPANRNGRRREARNGVPDQPDIEFLLLRVLARERQIPPGPEMWMNLALSLARELYPEQKRPGPDEKWTVERRQVLIVEVENLRKAFAPSETGVKWACKELSKRQPWTVLLGPESREPAESLRRTYYDSIKDSSLVEQARQQYAVLQGVGDWDVYVAEILA
jgi:hypothetical protein